MTDLAAEWDRIAAAARAAGNDALANHMDALRPNINFDDTADQETRYSVVAEASAKALMAVANAIGADPFDTAVICTHQCAYVAEMLQAKGISPRSLLVAMGKHLLEIAERTPA